MAVESVKPSSSQPSRFLKIAMIDISSGKKDPKDQLGAVSSLRERCLDERARVWCRSDS